MTGIVDFRTVVEDENGDPITDTNPFPVTPVSQGLTVLQRIAALLKPLQQITGGGSNRLSVDVNNVVGGSVAISSGTVTTVTTVSTVTTVTGVTAVSSLTNFANVWTFDQAKAISRLTYNQGIRSRVT